ncbi:glycosyltransferase family 4 protein [Hymenobacter busanensis]|uniref:Glycosyltransferase family 4 protein n=1 Tax=Hymenobacter busanensis TaxID=2607656 RepID=A0A7L4ZVC1_9BACT|nr:glycosyltransferase family 4 protein [Hymenobacter busanensis]KAA9332279.1 glycosyltransferase family 4 protein [Hymenobacter busanensis]QHJ07384.1 glycosyltransferase [Hymenobacter busanensis]
MKILFLTPYPQGEAPSQRFRFEQYLPALRERGIEYAERSFLDLPTWRVLYKPGHTATKIWGIVKGFGRRLAVLPAVPAYDYVFIHREVTPIGPPIFEWIISKVLGKKIIYDFDDAIWMALTSKHNQMAAIVKWHSKVADICRWSYKVSCGNDFLCEYARQYNSRVVLNPTTIDTVHLHNRTKQQATDRVILGWTGTHSNIVYLATLMPVLRRLEEKYDFTFRVISNQDPQLELKSFDYLPWRKATEIDDLATFNVGVMPLEEQVSPLSLGKCGFKALQYMSLGIPAVASPVGVNTKIVTDGVDGFLCKDEEEWYQALARLIEDAQLRQRMGANAQRTVRERYSVVANTENFVRLFSADYQPASVAVAPAHA